VEVPIGRFFADSSTIRVFCITLLLQVVLLPKIATDTMFLKRFSAQKTNLNFECVIPGGTTCSEEWWNGSIILDYFCRSLESKGK
jgi:hypothetical protein